MALLIFRLRNVPDDEADDIRELLIARNIDFYETAAGNWGISMPGLWLNHDTDAAEAKALIRQYQEVRKKRAREDYLAQKNAGQHRTVLDSLKERPLVSAGLIVFCAAVIYISVHPFLTLIDVTR